MAWVVLSQMLFENDLIHVVASTLPYFIAYELGVFSRYLPGMKTAAKRLGGRHEGGIGDGEGRGAAPSRRAGARARGRAGLDASARHGEREAARVEQAGQGRRRRRRPEPGARAAAAALLAAAIIATHDKKLRDKLEAFRKKQSESVLAAKLPR